MSKYIIVQSLNNNCRVRLLDGSLTPVFDYPSQAFNYCEGKNILHADIIKI